MEIFIIVIAYFIGAIPMGYIVVKLFTGKDLTKVGSGRTGGTNAMRAGSEKNVGDEKESKTLKYVIFILTSVLDLSKGYVSILIAKSLFPDGNWIHVFTGVMAVIGHNWSIWLYLFKKQLSAGAGTAPNIGVAIAFWPNIGIPSILSVLFFVFFVGYASVASMFVAILIPISFFIRSVNSESPWEYVIYGLLSALLVLGALRPNIKRLLEGKERRVGLFANKQ